MNREIIGVQREREGCDVLRRVLFRTRRFHLTAALTLLAFAAGLQASAALSPDAVVGLPMWGKALLIVLLGTSLFAGGYCFSRAISMWPLSRTRLLRILNDEPQRVTRLEHVEVAFVGGAMGRLSFVRVELADHMTIPLSVGNDDLTPLLDHLRGCATGAVELASNSLGATAPAGLSVAFPQRGTHPKTPR